MTDNVFWVVEVTLAEGKLEEFRALMTEMVDATFKNEPGALNYEWSISPDKRICNIFERYKDPAAAMTHLATFGARFAGRMMACGTPTRFTVYGAPDAAVKEALGPAGAVFMEHFGGFSR